MTIAVLLGLGLVGVSIALGMLYRNETAIARATLEAELRGQSLTDSERDLLLAEYDNAARFLTAFVFGTVGVGLVGFGGALGLFEVLATLGAGRVSKPVPGPPGAE